MGFDDEEAVAQYQKKLIEDEAAGDDDQSDDNLNNNSNSEFDSDEEGNGQLLDIESLRARDSELTEKQRSMLSKVEGIRRNLKKLLDKKFKLKNQEELEFDDTKVKGELKGLDKRALDLKEQLEKAESKLKTSIRGTSHKKKGKEDEEEGAAMVERRKNSDDEVDEFFDRTKVSQFKSNNNGGA
jgi:hypothetical protein